MFNDHQFSFLLLKMTLYLKEFLPLYIKHFHQNFIKN